MDPRLAIKICKESKVLLVGDEGVGVGRFVDPRHQTRSGGAIDLGRGPPRYQYNTTSWKSLGNDRYHNHITSTRIFRLTASESE